MKNIFIFLLTTSALFAEKPSALKLNWVMDKEIGIPIGGFHTPLHWKFESKVQWNVQNIDNPVVIFAQGVDEKKMERIQFLPAFVCYWLSGQIAGNPGGMQGGLYNLYPQTPEVALANAMVKVYRADIANYRITGVRKVPGLLKALKVNNPKAIGVGLRAEFSVNGVKVEEEVYAVYETKTWPFHGEAGETIQTLWGLSQLHAFTVPMGTMDKRRSFFTYMVRSLHLNPAWQQKKNEIQNHLRAGFAQKMAENRAARERIMAQSRAVAARSEAFRANIMKRHRASMDSTSHDQFIDTIHEVETFHDPYHGTSKQSYAKQHWTDGWGNYIHSDNVNYDPNVGSQIQWQQMRRVNE